METLERHCYPQIRWPAVDGTMVMGHSLTPENELLADFLTGIDCCKEPWSYLTLCPKLDVSCPGSITIRYQSADSLLGCISVAWESAGTCVAWVKMSLS